MDRVDVLDESLRQLRAFQARSGARGRFIALYLGLRRMGERVAPLGSATYTPLREIETYLDHMWTKRHRADPLVVLTAPFGSSGANGGYSTATGIIAPGNRYATNTWRNNLNVQKGVGCAADPETIVTLLADPNVRMACPFMEISPDGHLCGITGTAYRGEEHAIWLSAKVEGYQVADLTALSSFGEYLVPAGQRIPIFAVIGALYGLSPDGLYPARSSVGIPEFASDFGFRLREVEEIFDCEAAAPGNAEVLGVVAGGSGVFDDAGLAAAPVLPELGDAILLNSGLGAELAVAYLLRDLGWEVEYTGGQQNLGYDLRATRDGGSIQIEVKSSVGFTVPILTQSEWTAALDFADSYVLAVVDFYGSEKQELWFVRNPAAGAEPKVNVETTYRIARSQVEVLRTEVDFL